MTHLKPQKSLEEPKEGLPEIWLAVKKTGENWDCKLRDDDKTETIGKYWGFKDTKPTVQFKDKYQDVTYNFETMKMKNNTLKGPNKGKWMPFQSWTQRGVINSGLVTAEYRTFLRVRSSNR